jgi:hypothetical protein
MAQRMRGKEGNFPNWVSNTGSALRAFAEHYFYTRDRRWLESLAPAMVKACNWIIETRQTTKEKDAQGEKVLHYGLMPAGQPYDTEAGQGPDYYYCMTDGYTYQGFKRMAEALVDAQHPEGTRLRREADSYGQDILEAMRRARRSDPNLPPYPERLRGSDGWGSLGSGELALIDAGLVAPEDPVFEQIESFMKSHFNYNVLGLSGRCHADDPHVPGSYYMVSSEDVYHYAFVTRGDVEKALLSLYSALAFGVDKDTLGAIERFSLYDRRYAPFFIDSSGGMRICLMIRRTLLLEKETELRLLPAAPRHWLEAGKTIQLEDMPTYFGEVNLSVESQVQRKRIVADLKLRLDRPDRLKKVSLRIPHPTKQRMKEVTIDRQPWTRFSSETETIQVNPLQRRHEIVVQY